MEAGQGSKPKVTYAQFMAALPEKRRGTVAWVIETHIKESLTVKPVGPSQRYILRAIQADPIGAMEYTALEDTDVIDFIKRVRQRRTRGTLVGAATAMQYYTFLHGAFKNVRSTVKGCKDIKLDIFKDAKPTLQRLQLVGKSKPRTRRPTKQEIDLILSECVKREARRNNKIPYTIITEVSLLTARRISETCRLTWGDVDHANRTCWVRDLKNSKGKGYHDEFPLLGRAWDIVMAQPRLDPNNPDELIFKTKDGKKINAKSTSQGYASIKRKLAIKGLRLHDNRADCISRLFEEGYSVPQVAKVSLHRNPTQLLGTYTRLKAADLHRGPAGKRAE
jgi:integrase